MVSATEDRKGPTFGKGAATLLHGIEENGSLNKTAKNLHMAYSKAWSMTRRSKRASLPAHRALWRRGSKLTEDGEEFLKLYDVYDKKVEAYADKVFRETFKDF